MDIFGIIETALKGVSIGLLASIPLGPIGVLCVQRTINKGRWSGFASGAGAATSDFLYAIVACFSVSFVTSFVEANQFILFAVGMLVLVALGLKMILSDPRKLYRRRSDPKSKKSLWQDFVSTFFLTLPNPLALFAFLTIFSLLDFEGGFVRQISLVVGVLFGALLWWLFLTLMVGLFRNKVTIRRLLYFNRIAGSVIILLVLVTAVSQIIKFLA